MTWTPERVEQLKQLWTAGHSASAIGKHLGVSKNAVVGKAHRLQLTARPSPIRKETGSASPRRRAPSLEPSGVKAAPAPAAPLSAAPVSAASVSASQPARPAAPALAAKAAPEKAPARAVAKPAVAPVRAAAPASPPQAQAPQASAHSAPARPAPARPVQARPAQLRPLRARSAPKGQACQWPIGDPSDANFSFCGKPAAAGKPYCSEHCSVAYITKSREKDSQAA